MSCSKVPLRPRPDESLIDGVVGQIFDGDDGVVAPTGVDIPR